MNVNHFYVEAFCLTAAITIGNLNSILWAKSHLYNITAMQMTTNYDFNLWPHL